MTGIITFIALAFVWFCIGCYSVGAAKRLDFIYSWDTGMAAFILLFWPLFWPLIAIKFIYDMIMWLSAVILKNVH